MIFQIEDAREARAGKFVFTPGTIGVLLIDEVGDRFVNRRIAGVSAREQSDQAPSGLRRGAWPFALGLWLGVAAQRFAETAIGFLDRAQPADSTLAIFFRRQ